MKKLTSEAFNNVRSWIYHNARQIEIEKGHPIMLGIFKFLESGVHSNEKSWLFSILSNDNWPRAPWWTYNPEAVAVESIGA